MLRARRARRGRSRWKYPSLRGSHPQNRAWLWDVQAIRHTLRHTRPIPRTRPLGQEPLKPAKPAAHPTRGRKVRWCRWPFSFVTQISQPSIDLLLPTFERSQDSCVLSKRILFLAGATNHGSVALDDEFNKIASFKTETFPNWLRNRNLSLAGDDASVDIPFHEVRIPFLTYLAAANSTFCARSALPHSRNPITHSRKNTKYRPEVSHRCL